MKIAASSIAWPVDLDAGAGSVLCAAGAAGVELAPTRLWADLSQWDPTEADAHLGLWRDHGLEVVGMQALLYGQPDLQVFASSAERRQTLDYLQHAIDIAARWQARVLVFGSPKNRRAGSLEGSEAMRIAAEFFAELAELASDKGCVIGLEANPAEYGGDFLTRSDEAIEFVEGVGHPGLGCHLDLGGMILSGEDPAQVIERPTTLQHVHASEPFLAGLGAYEEVHAAAGRALRDRDYAGWVSVEMRTDPEDPLAALERAVEVATRAYGGSGNEGGQTRGCN